MNHQKNEIDQQEQLPIYKLLEREENGFVKIKRPKQFKHSDPNDKKMKTERKKQGGVKSKLMPEQRSSKIPVKLFAPQQLRVNKKFHRDPRFDRLSGSFNYDLYNKSYSFLDKDMKQRVQHLKQDIQQIKSIKSKLSRKKSKRKLSNKLYKLDNQQEWKQKYATQRNIQGAIRKYDKQMKLKRLAKAQNKQRAKKGFSPYYNKKRNQSKKA